MKFANRVSASPGSKFHLELASIIRDLGRAAGGYLSVFSWPDGPAVAPRVRACTSPDHTLTDSRDDSGWSAGV